MLNSPSEEPLIIENINIEPEQYVKLFGILIDSNLNFTYHVDNLCKKASNQIRVLKRLSCNLDQGSRMQIFRSFILAHSKYCAIVYHFCGKGNTETLTTWKRSYRASKLFIMNLKSLMKVC